MRLSFCHLAEIQSVAPFAWRVVGTHEAHQYEVPVRMKYTYSDTEKVCFNKTNAAMSDVSPSDIRLTMTVASLY